MGSDVVTRWSARFELTWPPILSFDRRRSEYLDWLEKHVKPFGFVDEADHTGVAPNSMRERLVVDRSGMSLELRSTAAAFDGLRSAVSGAIESFEPRVIRVAEYRANWTMRLAGDYEAVRQRFSKSAFPQSEFKTAGLTLSDAAFFMEARTTLAVVKFDFGIVNALELGERLHRPEMTRIGGLPSPPTEGSPDQLDLPAVAAFVDLTWRPHDSHVVGTADEVHAELSNAEDEVSHLVADLCLSVQ